MAPLMAKMEEYLADHNANSKRPMDLAVFLYAVEHVSRVCRVLKQPGKACVLHMHCHCYLMHAADVQC